MRVDAAVLLWGLAWLLVAAVVVPYVAAFRRRLRQDRERQEEAVALCIDRPVAQYPFVDATRCIGCGACVRACPEGDVLGVVGGTAVVINGLRCVGHGRCEAACPVGAIEVGLGDLRGRADVPRLDARGETTVPGIFVVGELGGLALVRNALAQGRGVVAAVAERRLGRSPPDGFDLVVAGAGPSGLATALAAQVAGLSCVVVEREPSLGGSLLHYPRRKMVLTQPVELPPWGALDREEYAKEELLELLERMVADRGLHVRYGEALLGAERTAGERLLVRTSAGGLDAGALVLALGRRGAPRKLGIPGEELAKVMYCLLDAEGYTGQHLLVVGGGDSAAEAAIGLARQRGNVVTLSYRREKLVRLKRKNQEALEPLLASGAVRARFGSRAVAIRPGEVVLRLADGGEEVLRNDYVFVFAGGEPPFPLLAAMGVVMGGDAAGVAAQVAPSPERARGPLPTPSGGSSESTKSR